MAYQRPMVTVDQNMTVKPVSTDREQPAFVFGPQYELHRYSDENEKAGTRADKDWAGSSISFPYPKVIDSEKVDQKYTKLVGENVVVELANLTGDGHATLAEADDKTSLAAKAAMSANGGYTKLLIDKDFIDDSSGSSGYDGLPKKLKAGDQIVVFYTQDSAEQSLMTLVKEVEYSATGHNVDSDSSFEVGAGTLITIEEAIPDANLDTSSVKVSLVAVIPSYEFDRKNIAKFEAGDTNPGLQWTQGRIEGDAVYGNFDGITVTALNALVTANYFTEETWCKVLFADLYVTYRELVTSNSDTIHSLVGGASAVEDLLGTVDPDNPLAQGLYMAALNAATDDGTQAPVVYYMATPTDDANGYNEVLKRAATTDRVYVLAPTTQDDSVLESVKNHVVKYSSKEEKLWRIAAGSAEVPRTVNLLENLMDVQGDEFLAIPVSDAGTATGQSSYDKIRVVKSASDITGSPDVKFRSTVKEGDFIRFNYRDSAWANYGDQQVYDVYKVLKVVNNYTLKVEHVETKGGVSTEGLTPAASSYKPAKIEVYHEYTSAETAELIASISRNFASRRMLNVFPTVFENNGVQMSGEFAACAVAGLISATEPQQPITNLPVQGIDNIPLTYQTYNKEELDVIAAGGTFIVAQDLPGDLVYVRHQITTATYEGNLNTRELSVTKNVDSISYAFADVFRPYYGKYNIVPGLVEILHATAVGLINQLGGGASLYGPQLIRDDTVINYIRQNEFFKDHVDVSISLAVPYPCNVIEIVLTV